MTDRAAAPADAAGSGLACAIPSALWPEAPAEVLLLAAGGQPGREIASRGYRVTVLDWSAQSDWIGHPSPDGRGLRRVNLVPLQGRIFDMVVVDGLTPQVHPLALLEPLERLLAVGGRVVLRAAVPTPGAPPRMPGWLDYVVAVGRRLGFVAVEGPPVPGGLRVLQKDKPPRWRLGHVWPEDFADIARLFAGVFGHPMSRELWSWKYGEGRGNAVLVRRHGEVVAHYGGMYRRIVVRGEPDWAFQICDVMVHAQERGVLTRQGPFFLAATTCAEIYGPLGYGFPTRRAMQVAEKMGLYAPAGELAQLRWTPAAPRWRLRTRARHLHAGAGAADRARVDALWDAMRRDLRDGVVGVRDWATLAHRYLAHPHHVYELLLVSARLGGAPLGLAVLRRHEEDCELVDLVGPLRHLGLVVDQARRMTARWGKPSLWGWITRNHLPLLQATGAREEPLDISIPTSCWTADARAEAMKGRWWLMAGDTDFR